MTVARVRGLFRLERDSIFFDERAPSGTTVVSMAGTHSGDSLFVVVAGLRYLARDSADVLPMKFVRQR